MGIVQGAEREADPVPGAHGRDHTLDRELGLRGGEEPRDAAVLDRHGAPPRIDREDATLPVETWTRRGRPRGPEAKGKTERGSQGWPAAPAAPATIHHHPWIPPIEAG